MTTLQRLLQLSIIGMMVMGLFGCEDEGPMEEAGDAMEETADEAGDAVEEATD